MASTKINPTDGISPSKAAELYREDGGKIFYVCFHCGTHFDNIDDTLIHIEYHFESRKDIEIDEKHERVNDIPQEVVNTIPVEEIITECDIESIILKEEQCFQNNTSEEVLPDLVMLSTIKDFSDMDGIIEWKCLYCSKLLNKFTKLKNHLIKHIDDPLPSIHTLNQREKIKAQYSFQCTLCSSEFYDSSSSEQHLQDVHGALPPVKCISCCRNFASTVLLKDHMSTVHSGSEHETNDEAATTNQHVMIKELNKLIMCPFCDKTFNRIDFIQHTFGHFDLKIFTCPECPSRFQLMASTNEHVRNKHSKKLVYNFQCRFCDEKVCYSTLLDFVTHAFTHHLDEGDRNNSDLDSTFSYDCRFCFTIFTKWDEAFTHLKSHGECEVPKSVSTGHPEINSRCFTERAQSVMYRNELLYNCSYCSKTLCGSFEARQHWIIEHKQPKQKLKNYGCQFLLPENPFLPTKASLLKEDHPPKKDHPPKEKPGNLRYKCYDCDSAFELQNTLMKHRLTHFYVEPYSCKLCQRKFSFNSNAIAHMARIHKIDNSNESVQHNCLYCKAVFDKDSIFIQHTFDEHLYVNFKENENLDGQCKYECVYCKEILPERGLMDEHLQIHGNEVITEIKTVIVSAEQTINALQHKVESMYCCLYCPKKFRLAHAALEHVKKTHNKEIKEKQILENKEKEKRHVEENKDNPYTCDVCNEKFISWQIMISHQGRLHSKKIKDKDKPKSCEICKEEFISWRSMVNHIAQKHRDGQQVKAKPNSDVQKQPKKKRKSIPTTHCSICNMAFVTWRSMLNHRSKKHKETIDEDRYKNCIVFSCSICNKTFRERSNFKKHKETHAKLHSFSCDICNKTYRLKNSLMTHMLSHTKQKDFVCDICGKSYYTVSKLNLHRQIHENLKFTCQKCEKVFYTRNNFSKHQKTHLDKPRLKCTVCYNTFKSRVSLRVHMLLHTGKKNFACRFCDMTFVQLSGRRGHEKSSHGSL